RIAGRDALRLVEGLHGCRVVAPTGFVLRLGRDLAGELLGRCARLAAGGGAGEAHEGVGRGFIVRTVAQGVPVRGDRLLRPALLLVDHPAVVVALGVERVERDGDVELLLRVVVPPERPEGAGEARVQGTVVRILLHQLAERLARLFEAPGLEVHGGHVAVAVWRLGAEIAEAPQALEHLRVDGRVGGRAGGRLRARLVGGDRARRVGEVDG